MYVTNHQHQNTIHMYIGYIDNKRNYSRCINVATNTVILIEPTHVKGWTSVLVRNVVTVSTVTLMLNLHKNNTTSSMNALNAPQNIINVTTVPHEVCANLKK